MPKDEDEGIDYAALQRAYEYSVIGRNAPTYGTCNGAVLNHFFGEEKYDPERMYVVSPEGITEITD